MVLTTTLYIYTLVNGIQYGFDFFTLYTYNVHRLTCNVTT